MNYAQHQIERWGNPLESESTALTNAADVIQMVQDTQASICKELGDTHVACAYCTSMLGGSNDSVSRHAYWLCRLLSITRNSRRNVTALHMGAGKAGWYWQRHSIDKPICSKRNRLLNHSTQTVRANEDHPVALGGLAEGITRLLFR
jgi:hypothetical protein